MRTANFTSSRSWWHWSGAGFFLLDFFLCALAVQAAYRISPRIEDYAALTWGEWAGLPVIFAVSLQLAGVQVNQAGFRGAESLTRILVGGASALLVFVTLQALIGFELTGRYVLGFTFVLGTAAVLGSRWVIWRLAEKETRNVVFLGSEASRENLAKRTAAARLPVRIQDEKGAGEIVVEDPDLLSREERERLLALMADGVEVTDLNFFYERELEQVWIDGLRESWFWRYDPMHTRPFYFSIKRGLDVVFSGLGLIAVTPVAFLIAAGIWLNDGKPVIYSQARVGLRGRIFRIYKFRTMRTDAEKDGARWADPEDARVTGFGRMLRRTRLDELPQLWNIFFGDMSFIGPRPERPEMIAELEASVPFYRHRCLVKPGLTGWAQINYPYGASVADAREKLSYDLYYIKYASLTNELLIALRTISAFMRGSR
jgi:lipopolysaccharide/colanic/teichoic acid biosynthesis glycosyltransferase